MTACLGIDIGGTSIKAARIRRDGVLDGSLVTVPIDGDPLDAVARAAAEARGDAEILAAGIGTPGYLDLARTTVQFAVNLGWRDLPLAAIVEQQLGLPVAMDGDAAAAALGEALAGSGQGHRDVLMVTLGTGIGVGHVVDGVIVSGAHGRAGDAGHVAMPGIDADCPCGRHGCWELAASTAALDRRMRATGHADVASALEDAGARDVVDAWADDVAAGLAMLAAVLDPGVIVLGGAVSASADAFLPRVRDVVSRTAPHVEIVPAALGAAAGAVGAGLLAWQQRVDHSERTR